MVTGTGISTDPYMIYNLADLELVGTGSYALSAYYELANDIDASATSGSTYNSGQGFIPIGGGGGPTANRFNGDFNGNGYTVSGLYINTPSIGYVGLIGLISNPGKVHDLTVDCNITAGSTIGAIAGYSLVTDNRTDVISNCTVHGTITGTDTVGAIIGGKDPGNDIVNCNSDAIVTGTIHVGGIIGAVTDGRCNITNCNFTGSVISTASSPQYIGGLIGYINTWDTVNNSIVSGCNVTGTITANNGSYIGGIVGATNSGLVELEHCNFTGIINNNSGTGSNIGGIVGNSNGNIITYCDATGTLNSSTSFQYVGGIAGGMNNGGNVENCKCIMNLTGSNDVGGIIGLNLGTPITNCNYQGNIVGSGYVGGIVGDNESGAISECKSSGSITASGNYVGGISGTGASGSYGNCQANMNISASGSNYVGGLTGNGGGAITNCSYNGNITANSRSGGLVGGDSANISQSYSLGSINGSGDYIGGVVGVCENSTISDTYSFMAVTALGNISGGFGGFVLNSTISRCYSAGAVANGTHVHGFGENEGGNTITDCFWDTQTSGQGSNAYDLSATGELTTAMQTELTYTGFDFTTPIWVINSSLNGGYPYLANTPLPPIPLNFYGNILNTSSIAGKVTEGSAVLLSVYGGILNTSNISGKVTELLETFTVYGNVSNISNLNPKLVRKSSLKTSISNLSDLKFLLGSGGISLKGLVANTSILNPTIYRTSKLGMVDYNVSSFYPYLQGDLIYFSGAISNISRFNPTLSNDIYYLIENSQHVQIGGITFEAVYQGKDTNIQAIILESIEGNPDLTVTIQAVDLNENDIPQSLEPSSVGSSDYIQLSTSVNGTASNSLTLTVPAGGSATFYIQADIPADAVAGGWICNLKTSVTVNGSIYNQNLTLSGTVLTGNPLVQVGASPNLPVIAEMADGNYNNITKFTIDDKINAVVKTFEIDYSTAEYWKIFETGQQVILLQGNTTMLNGTLQAVDEKGDPGDHTFVMTGRDQALALINQSFSAAINCPVAASATGGSVLVNAGITFQQVLNMILANTPIQMGSTASALIPNSYTGGGLQFCGSWSTKKIAIDYFFYLLAADGGPDLCWFVDNDGFLQVFDATNPGAVSLIIPMSDQILYNVEFDDNSENVVNQITAYGGTNNGIVVTVSDQESIATYGLIEGPNLQDASLTTEGAVQAAAEAQLALNNVAVYTATITLPQFPGAVSGQPIMFPGHPKYGNTAFIISEVQRTGVQAHYTTTITATTDPNVISPLESFDMVQVVADNSVAQNLPVVGVAGDISADGSQVTVTTVGGVVAANILNPLNGGSNGSGGNNGGGSGLNEV